jgi:hypothetical protein
MLSLPWIAWMIGSGSARVRMCKTSTYGSAVMSEPTSHRTAGISAAAAGNAGNRELRAHFT